MFALLLCTQFECKFIYKFYILLNRTFRFPVLLFTKYTFFFCLNSTNLPPPNWMMTKCFVYLRKEKKNLIGMKLNLKHFILFPYNHFISFQTKTISLTYKNILLCMCMCPCLSKLFVFRSMYKSNSSPIKVENVTNKKL